MNTNDRQFTSTYVPYLLQLVLKHLTLNFKKNSVRRA